MENLVLEATQSSPQIVFDAETGVLEIKGKSYPENPAEFYAPVLRWLKDYLDLADTDEVVVNMEVIYLNSSSSKAFLNLLQALDDAAVKGKRVTVNWRYHKENEIGLECGEEFGQDLESLTFNLVEIAER